MDSMRFFEPMGVFPNPKKTAEPFYRKRFTEILNSFRCRWPGDCSVRRWKVDQLVGFTSETTGVGTKAEAKQVPRECRFGDSQTVAGSHGIDARADA